MIRFSCPQCGKTLKVPEQNAGKSIVCPRCRERSPAPATEERPLTAASPGRHGTRDLEPPQGLISGMDWRVRAAVAVVAGVGALGLLWPVLSSLWSVRGSVPDATTPWAAILVTCSVVLLLVILYGQGTSCPSCRAWWVRTKVETEFVDREVFDKGGVPFGRSLYRITYQCDSCRYKWSVSQTDEYREPIRSRQQQPRG